MAMFIVKPWYRKKDDAIYGAEWAGTSDPSWVRTDAAVGFSNPNPYYSGMSTTPSSPFDNIMPWSGMRRVTDANAGELVEIPKFYYKWTRDGVKMKLQISMSAFDGSHVSPAHANRGDGVGERDYVYVGRYHCASDYKSKSGVAPTNNKTKGTFRSNIHALGSNVWQQDYAMFWTIRMLYLVEYANWDSQAMIGKGSGTSGVVSMGYTDNMPYHTGTTLSSRTSFGYGTQYRYIEGMWDQVYEWCDGVYVSSKKLYAINNPSNFSDSTNGVLVGDCTTYQTGTTGTNIKEFNFPEISGYEWALSPKYVGDSDWTHYTTDYAQMEGGSTRAMAIGGAYDQQNYYGLFFMYAFDTPSQTSGYRGSRLMVLPPSRLSA